MFKKFAALLTVGLLMLTACQTPTAVPPTEIPEPESREEEAIFFVPEMTDDQNNYYENCVRPILFSSILFEDWSAEDFTSLMPDNNNRGYNLLFAFEDTVGPEKMQELRAEHGENLPANQVDKVLLARFPFSREQLREILANAYDAESDVYKYGDGRGGGPIEAAVTDVSVLEDGKVRLTYEVFTVYIDTIEGKDGYSEKTVGTMVVEPYAESYRILSVNALELHQSVTD